MSGWSSLSQTVVCCVGKFLFMLFWGRNSARQEKTPTVVCHCLLNIYLCFWISSVTHCLSLLDFEGLDFFYILLTTSRGSMELRWTQTTSHILCSSQSWRHMENILVKLLRWSCRAEMIHSVGYNNWFATSSTLFIMFDSNINSLKNAEFVFGS